MKTHFKYREGRGAMVRAWRFVIVVACRAGSAPALTDFPEKYQVSPFQRWDIVSNKSSDMGAGGGG